MDRREQRVAENELLFRRVNEQIQTLDNRLGVSVSEPQRFLCECGDPDCTDRIELTTREYARIHDDPATFVIVDGHDDPSVETVIERHDRFAVVRKDEGGPAEYVRDRSPEREQ